MANKRIQDLPAKGATIAANDILEVSEYQSPGVYTSKKILGSELGGVTSFEDLTDTFTFAGNELETVRVNAAGTALETYTPTTVSTGRFGIADSSGVYTYYTTLTLAMTAATSGQTIEFFTDYTETGAVTITLKDGVNINGNGHTYILNNAGTSNAFSDNTVSINCNIYNLTIQRSGGVSSPTDSLALRVANSTSVIYLNGVNIHSTFGCSAWISGEVVGGNYTAITSGFALLVSNTIKNATYYSANGLARIDFLAQKCIFKSDGNWGVYCLDGRLIDCVGYSSSSYGIYAAGDLVNCTGYSSSSYGIYATTGDLVNCTGLSTSVAGIYYTSKCVNSTAISTASYGALGGPNSYLYNSYIQSSTALSLFTQGVAYNSSIVSLWNNSNGHAVGGGTVGYAEICNCILQVTNNAANCLNYTVPITTKYANNTFKGATTPVNANITQGVSNTHDSQGNILI